ncbi:MAG: signal recognition particle-docking protein FtsY [Eubacteriaceae bacterium]|jgi:fused signal recognition particle receptor
MAEGSIFQRMKQGLAKTAGSFNEKIDQLIYYSNLDDDFFEELEENLILADLGVETAVRITEELRGKIVDYAITDKKQVIDELREILYRAADVPDSLLHIPSVMVVVGVNGVGKTTTIAKLAQKYHESGLKVMVAAADTFRAAATEQLETWAERVDVPIIKGNNGADPSSVVFDALNAAKARGTEVLIVDTAGRLHNKVNLMKELDKIARVVEREGEGFHQHNLLIVDATTGQNALNQARIFNQAIPLNGIVMTKMDGTAKGGVALSILDELKIPIEYIGVGEKAEDLIDFSPRDFVDIITGGPESEKA